MGDSAPPLRAVAFMPTWSSRQSLPTRTPAVRSNGTTYGREDMSSGVVRLADYCSKSGVCRIERPINVVVTVGRGYEQACDR